MHDLLEDTGRLKVKIIVMDLKRKTGTGMQKFHKALPFYILGKFQEYIREYMCLFLAKLHDVSLKLRNERTFLRTYLDRNSV